MVGARCTGIIKKSQLQCTACAHDDGDRCGRHGGPNKVTARRARQATNVETITAAASGVRTSLGNILDSIRMENMSLYDSHTKSTMMDFERVPCKHCCICLDDNTGVGVVSPCCKQTSCEGCMKKWLDLKSSCPTCRANIGWCKK